jgi:hypothetical protein
LPPIAIAIPVRFDAKAIEEDLLLRYLHFRTQDGDVSAAIEFRFLNVGREDAVPTERNGYIPRRRGFQVVDLRYMRGDSVVSGLTLYKCHAFLCGRQLKGVQLQRVPVTDIEDVSDRATHQTVSGASRDNLWIA